MSLGRIASIGLVVGVAAALVAFVVAPLAVLVARGLGLPDAPSLGALREGLGRGGLGALANTVTISLGATALALVVATPAAFLLGRCELPRPRLFRTLLSLPAVLPPYLVGIAWLDLANPRTGLLNRALLTLGADGPLFDCYTRSGIVWVLGLCFYPFVLLPTIGALERMDASLEESARIAGASPARVLVDVTLPLALPAIASGAVLVFLATAATFGVPYLLGTSGSERIDVLTTSIAREVTIGGADALRRAIALSLVLLVLSLGVSAVGDLFGRNERRFAVVSGKGQRPRPLVLSTWARRAATLGLALVVLLAIGLPLGTLLFVSFLRVWGGEVALANLGLGAYRAVLVENHDTLPALLRSVLLATAAALLAVAVGFVIAYARLRRPGWSTRLLASLANAPYAIPGTIVALGLVVAWSQELRFVLFDHVTLALDLFGGAGALLVAYATKYLAFGVRVSGTALAQIDPSLEEAARVAGASRPRAARDVVLPLCLPGLFTAFVLVFLPTLSEITMSVLLAGPGTQVVGTILFELQSYADPPSAAALATILLVLTLVGNELLRRASGGKGGL